jgi:hypothetical protein
LKVCGQIVFLLMSCRERTVLCRIGHHRSTSRWRSRNCTRISATPSLFPVVFDETARSTSPPISHPTPLRQISVNFFHSFLVSSPRTHAVIPRTQDVQRDGVLSDLW